MRQKNILLICGGGSSEHDISLLSANYLETNLIEAGYQVLRLELQANGQYLADHDDLNKQTVQLVNQQVLFADQSTWTIDLVIPCIHGFPGETGDIQSYLELQQLPYLGCGSEASVNCFNKITAKMWFSALGIPNTPYLILAQNDQAAHQQAQAALAEWGSIFIKAASQGSSVGCYKVDRQDQLASAVDQAFAYSPYVIVEKTIVARELEVAVYQYQGQIVTTKPGEIVCASNTFYSFDEKYAANSQAVTHIEAPNLSEEISEQLQQYARKAFEGLKLRHLSRIDFFLTEDNEILLNEINTFPGMTPISMFPKMLINHGDDFSKVLQDQIETTLAASKK